MFKIGEFAKISQVAAKTLRYYNDIGLFKPDSVDASTGYRYYTLEQLPYLNRILALKDLGFSLEQIAVVLKEPLALSELRGMLRLRQAELQQILQTEQARLTRVEARLRFIENEGMLPAHEIVVKRVEAQTLLSMRQKVPSSEEIYTSCQNMGIRIYQQIEARAIKEHGPLLTVYHDEENYTGRDADIDIEMGVLIDPAWRALSLPVASGLSIRELLEAEKVASMIYKGSYEGLWQAYGYMLNWIDAHHYRRTEPFRFMYLREGHQEGEPITELQFPIA